MYDRETQTGIYPALICENGASAALAMVASFLRASQMQVIRAMHRAKSRAGRV
jgi:hypothetical protein